MKDMKMSQIDQKETMPMEAGKPDSPRYPYGLEIRLGEAEMKKLGLSKMPEAGSVLMLTAKTKVTGTNVNANEKDKHRNMTLQITHMELEADEDKSEAEKAATVYPNQGK